MSRPRHLFTDPAWATATSREPLYRTDTRRTAIVGGRRADCSACKASHESGASRRMSYAGYIAVSDHELSGRLFVSQASALLPPRERA